VRAAAPAAIAAALIGIVVGIRACAVATPDEQLARGEARPGDPAGAVVRTGSIYLPRGGPYRIGAQASSPTTVAIGTHVIAVPGPRPACKRPPDLDCLGTTFQRIVLEAGVYPIRLAGPADARLVWNPIGRRGDPEYVPASSLDPRPPAQATFDLAAAGTSVGDGIAALAIGAILIALAAWTLRRRWRGAPRDVVIAVAAVFAVAAAIRLVDLGGAGQTFDEDTNWGAGKNYVTNVVSVDAAPRSWIWNYEHPPVMKYIAGAGAQLADGYGPARALSALVGAASCALLVLIGRRLYSLRAGVLAGVIGALTPHLIAHSKVVGHEAPSVLWWLLGIWLAVTAHDDDDDGKRTPARFAGLGVVLGLAIASRFANVLLAGALGGILLALAPRGARRRTIVLGFAILPVVAAATVFLVWPRLWTDPILHLQDAWARLSRPHSVEPYLGQLTNTPPPTYFLVYLAATAPVGLLAGAGAWVARAIAGRRDPVERRAALVLGIAFLAPLVIALSPVRQDGVRYVLPCVALLAVFAAAGFDWLAGRLAARVPRARRVAAPAIAGAVALYLAITAVRIHPYYLDYYGEHVGGPANVAARRWFETAWWGEGVDRAVDYVNAHAAPGAKVYRDCIAPAHLAWFRTDLWKSLATSPVAADWIVSYQPTAHVCQIPGGFVRAFTVDAQGAPLAIVYRRR
jgi:4-amino-4-deoxy-L-arabinose transferase-like glycosyltransferase